MEGVGILLLVPDTSVGLTSSEADVSPTAARYRSAICYGSIKTYFAARLHARDGSIRPFSFHNGIDVKGLKQPIDCPDEICSVLDPMAADGRVERVPLNKLLLVSCFGFIAVEYMFVMES